MGGFGKLATIGAAITAAMIAAGPGRASPPSTARSPIKVEDAFVLHRAGDAQISPDGHHLAYVRDDADIAIDGWRHSIRLVGADGSGDRLLADNAASPRWSPDGTRIAYVADGKLVVTGADRSAPRRLAGCAIDAGTPVWSPDGGRIAFTAFVAEPGDRYISPVAKPAGAQWAAEPRIVTKPVYLYDGQRVPSSGHVQLFVADVATGACRQITTGPADVDGAPAWTASGEALLFGSERGDPIERTYLTARLYRVAATGGPVTQLSPDGLGARAPVVSPDGRRILFIAARQSTRDYEPGNLYEMDVDGGQVHAVAPDLDREPMQATFAADGSAVYVSYGDHGVSVLARIGHDGRPQVMVRGLGGDAGYSIARDGAIAYLSGDFARPADVAVATPGGEGRRLTRLDDALLADRSVATIAPLAVTSSLDRAPVGAWLVTPGMHRSGRLPLILSIHGGPYGYDDPTWNLEDQLFAAAGYAVLHVNYRGSISYGFAFADRIAKDYPGPSYADLMSGVDAAIAAGVADPDRLFVTGGSAGGMLTAWIVGSTDRFRAAVALKPVINQIDDTLLTDQVTGGGAVVGAPPWDAPLRYWQRSPLSLAGKVKTPTLLMVGDDDHRTPVSEAQQFYAALQLLRVPTALVVVPDAGHNSIQATPSRLIASTAIILDWFARHGGEPAPAAIATGN